jgi:hypothetical protein
MVLVLGVIEQHPPKQKARLSKIILTPIPLNKLRLKRLNSYIIDIRLSEMQQISYCLG